MGILGGGSQSKDSFCHYEMELCWRRCVCCVCGGECL